MMVAEISREPLRVVWWEIDIVAGLHCVTLWWQRRSMEAQIAGGKGFAVVRPRTATIDVL